MTKKIVSFNDCPHKALINAELESIKKISGLKLDSINSTLDRILKHVEKTNGRVTRLEKASYGIGGAVMLVGADKLISVISSFVVTQPLV